MVGRGAACEWSAKWAQSHALQNFELVGGLRYLTFDFWGRETHDLSLDLPQHRLASAGKDTYHGPFRSDESVAASTLEEGNVHLG